VRGEGRLVWGALRAGGATLVPAVGVAWAFRGREGAAAAAIAVGLVVANLAVSAWILTLAARRSPENYPMIALPSYALRMGCVFAAMAAVHSTSAIDATTFSLTFAVGLVVILAYECLLWARTPWLALEYVKERP